MFKLLYKNSIACACGGCYQKSTEKRHQKTNRHINHEINIFKEDTDITVFKLREQLIYAQSKYEETKDKLDVLSLQLETLKLKKYKKKKDKQKQKKLKLIQEVEEGELETKPQNEIDKKEGLEILMESLKSSFEEPIIDIEEEEDSEYEDELIEQNLPKLNIHFTTHFNNNYNSFEKGIILTAIESLYEKNIKFQDEMKLFNYKINIYKGLHLDSVGKRYNQYHFNAYLGCYSNQSPKYHFYLNEDDEIGYITKIMSCFNT